MLLIEEHFFLHGRCNFQVNAGAARWRTDARMHRL